MPRAGGQCRICWCFRRAIEACATKRAGDADHDQRPGVQQARRRAAGASIDARANHEAPRADDPRNVDHAACAAGGYGDFIACRVADVPTVTEPPHFTSCQFFPQPTSTLSGTFSFIAAVISSRTTAASDSTCFCGVSKTSSSCTCSSIRLGRFSCLSRR